MLLPPTLFLRICEGFNVDVDEFSGGINDMFPVDVLPKNDDDDNEFEGLVKLPLFLVDPLAEAFVDPFDGPKFTPSPGAFPIAKDVPFVLKLFKILLVDDCESRLMLPFEPLSSLDKILFCILLIGVSC